MNNALRGVLAYKGERGYSAYEIAVKNGYVGSEKDWLSQLGTSSHLDVYKIVYTIGAIQSGFDIPENYTSNSYIDIYINGLKLNMNEYRLNPFTQQIELINMTLEEGAIVEIVVLTMSTNDLPIVSVIDNEATDKTTPSTKAVYDYFETFINRMHPIGSFYISDNNTNPSELFGGTWVQTDSVIESTYCWKRTA